MKMTSAPNRAARHGGQAGYGRVHHAKLEPAFRGTQWSNQPVSLARIFQIRFGNNFQQISKLYETNTSN
jgi:hypothetical protein